MSGYPQLDLEQARPHDRSGLFSAESISENDWFVLGNICYWRYQRFDIQKRRKGQFDRRLNCAIVINRKS